MMSVRSDTIFLGITTAALRHGVLELIRTTYSQSTKIVKQLNLISCRTYPYIDVIQMIPSTVNPKTTKEVQMFYIRVVLPDTTYSFVPTLGRLVGAAALCCN